MNFGSTSAQKTPIHHYPAFFSGKDGSAPHKGPSLYSFYCLSILLVCPQCALDRGCCMVPRTTSDYPKMLFNIAPRNHSIATRPFPSCGWGLGTRL